MTARTHRLADAGWLREGPLGLLLPVLDQGGEEARAVGGAVRNALLHEPFNDVDIATTARPDEVVRRVTAAGFKAVPTGIEHGTVTVVVESKPYEVTTLRRDVETDGRHAKVAFGRDWEEDALRRDFTINAMSATADGTVYDYTGGLDDVEARRIRFIGDASKRIAEDYLRILRFFRFHAAYGSGALDPDGVRACVKGRAGLEQLSRERVRMELLKLLAAPGAVPTLTVMSEAGLLLPVLGGVPQLASFAAMVKVQAAAGAGRDAVQRLGALAVWVAEDAERLWQRLRLFNAEHERLASMGEGWWRLMPGQNLTGHERDARISLYHLGPQGFTDRVLLAWSRSPAAADDPSWRALATLPQRWTAPVFPLKAADFIRRGVAKGPALGIALRAAEAAWLAADFPMDEGSLAAIVDAAVKA